MDHLSPLLQEIFPNSKIANGFSSARTKTMCIVNMALRLYLESLLIDQMKSQPFALAVDGSNDPGLQKMNPVTVRILYIEKGVTSTKFLDMCLTSGVNAGTADSIFTRVRKRAG